ncbi:MAG: hypothetical protein ABL914_13005 [Novosphingobium sp.]|uniref:hypothetical protein n=1 Tax=Novosphingobium sp. TaxID=1874826 RepID=UPI0032B941CF
MSLRSLVLAPLAALVLVPVPAFANDRAQENAELVSQLQDPRTQDAVGSALGAMVGALLGIKAEPFVRAAESVGNHDARRDVPAGATLGDLAGADARRLPRQIKRQVPHLMNAAGSMVGVMDQLAPQIEAIGRQMERDLGGLD